MLASFRDEAIPSFTVDIEGNLTPVYDEMTVATSIGGVPGSKIDAGSKVDVGSKAGSTNLIKQED